MKIFVPGDLPRVEGVMILFYCACGREVHIAPKEEQEEMCDCAITHKVKIHRGGGQKPPGWYIATSE